MDELMKGVKIGKIIGKDEKKDTCKIVAIVDLLDFARHLLGLGLLALCRFYRF